MKAHLASGQPKKLIKRLKTVFLGEKLVVKGLNGQIYYTIEVSVRNRTVVRPINSYSPFVEQKEKHQVCVNRCRIVCAPSAVFFFQLQAKNY